MKFAPSYLDAIYRDRTYEGLVSLSSMVCASDKFQPRQPTYGLSDPLLVAVEGLSWFAQAVRSGSITYVEATPPDRQQAMLTALRQHAPEDFSDHYGEGMLLWATRDGLAQLDQWMERNDERNTALLWQVAQNHRSDIEDSLS